MMEPLRLLLLSLSLVSVCPLRADGAFWSSWFDDVPCGTLHSSTGTVDLALNLSHGASHGNLEEMETKKGHLWNVTTSLEVKEGCMLKVCNASYFKGRCVTFTAQGRIIPAPNLDNVRSASCTCPPASTDCNDNVRFRRKNCALAYVNKGGCDSTGRLYTEIDVGTLPIFPEKYESKVSAVIVRPGCKLVVYSEHEFDGDGIQELTNVTRNVELPVKSTDCFCDYKVTVPLPKRRTRSAKDPKSIQIPSTFEELEKLRRERGELADHPGILSAMLSSRGNRSTRNAYILLLGTTGAGKSTTINLLFDTEVTSVGGHKSTTDQIHEFRIPVPVIELGINNSELRVIDTPGLGDTDGLEKDAVFLASLEHFLDQHEELKDRIPNIVLIFHKFTDNRFYGQQSNFVKMLRSLDSLRSRITDASFSNVVFVFSHFTSATGDITRDPKETLKKFKETIQSYSRFPRPTVMVVAENKPVEQGLLVENGYYKLPNGEYYPKNLLDAISKVASGGEDAIGNAVIRSGFKEPDFFKIARTDYNMTNSNDPEVHKFFKRLGELNYKNVSQTEVSEKLRVAYEKMPVKLQNQFPSVLPELQSSLNMKFITKVDQLPKTPEKTVELLSNLRSNEGVSFLLKEAFDLSAPEFGKDVVVGFGFDIFRDKYIKTSSPIELGEPTASSGIGYKLPSNLVCTELVQTVDEIKFVDSEKGYLKELIRSLGIAGTIPLEQFQGSIRPGWNIKSKVIIRRPNQTSTLVLTSVRYLRTFELNLPSRLFLTRKFTEDVISLKPIDLTSNSSVVEWKQFFSEYGTHVIKSVYGGGSITAKAFFSRDSVSQENLGFGFKFLDDISLGIERNRSAGFNSSYLFEGGDVSEGDTRDLTQMRGSDASERLRKWRESVKFNPVILGEGMTLIPMSVVVRKLGQHVSTEVEKAMRLLISADLEYKRPTTTPPPPRPSIQVIPPPRGFWQTVWSWFKSFFG